MIDRERAEKAIEFLTDTDVECAKAKSLLEGYVRQDKTIKSTAFLDAQGTVGERNARAEVSALATEHARKIENATLDYETLRNRRNTAMIVIDFWRSLEASRRKGNIV